MFRNLIHIFLLLLLSGIAGSLQAQSQGDVIFRYFNLVSDGADILVEWEVENEKDISRFDLFRRFADENTFTSVISIEPNGNLKYEFLDDDIFKSSSRTVVYELHVVTESKTIKFTKELLHSPTSIQRTWGSIKSMFR